MPYTSGEPDKPLPAEKTVPLHSKDFREGFREGYVQRMAEEEASKHGRWAIFRWTGPSKVVQDGHIIKIPAWSVTYEEAPSETCYDAHQEPIIFPEGDLDLSKPGPVFAAGAEEYDSDTASSRPEAPSLNRCWNRLETQRLLIRGLFDLFKQAQSEAGDAREVNEKTHRSLTSEIDRLDERIDNQRDWAIQRENEIESRRQGDVAALNERLDLIERILKSLPGIQEITPGTWVIETKPR